MHDTILDIRKISSFLTKAITPKKNFRISGFDGTIQCQIKAKTKESKFRHRNNPYKKKESEEVTSVKKEWEVHGTNYVFR